MTTWRTRTTTDDEAKEWKEFKKHWAAADKERCSNIKLSMAAGDGNNLSVKHQANAVTEQDIVSLIAASFSTMAEATQETIKESVNAAVERRMASNTQNNGSGGNSSNEVDSLKN